MSNDTFTPSKEHIESLIRQVDEADKARCARYAQLHKVDTSQIPIGSGISIGGCCTHECNEGRDCPERTEMSDKNYGFFLAFGTSAAIVIGIGCTVAKLAGWI